jgi:hypothetical protein
LKEKPLTKKGTRRESEKELRSRGEDVPFPGWERLAEEALEHGPKILLTVRDANGTAVRRIEGPADAGIHRVNWDLRFPSPDPIDFEIPGFTPPWADPPQGPLSPPGRYRVEMALLSADGIEPLSAPQEFEVKSVPGSVLPEPDYKQVMAFQEQTAELMRKAQGAAEELQRGGERLKHMRKALLETPRADTTLFISLDDLEKSIAELYLRLVGDRTRGRWNESSVPSILGRIRRVASGHWDTRQAPTETQRQSLEVARTGLSQAISELSQLLGTDLPRVEAQLEAAGAPWTPGRKLPPH